MSIDIHFCLGAKLGVVAFWNVVHLAVVKHVVRAINRHNRFTDLVTAVFERCTDNCPPDKCSLGQLPPGQLPTEWQSYWRHHRKLIRSVCSAFNVLWPPHLSKCLRGRSSLIRCRRKRRRRKDFRIDRGPLRGSLPPLRRFEPARVKPN